MFGVATSLGYGVLQVNAGLNHLFDLPISTTVQVGLIVGITSLATLSVVSGLDRGIRLLSELNLGLAVLLMLLVAALGPTVLLLKSFVENSGAYLSQIVSKTFNLYAYEPKSSSWLGAGRCCIGGGGCHGHPSSVCLSPVSRAVGPFVSLSPASCWCPPVLP